MKRSSALGSGKQLKDPDHTPPLAQAIPLGIQHVLAMFTSNVTPAIIVAGAAGFGFSSNSPDFFNLIYMIQMSILFAGISTLFQTIGMGPVGARLPIIQGTSILSGVIWNRRNMMIFAVALSIGLGLQMVPDALQHLPETLKILLTSGLLPAAAIAISLNLILPEEMNE